MAGSGHDQLQEAIPPSLCISGTFDGSYYELQYQERSIAEEKAAENMHLVVLLSLSASMAGESFSEVSKALSKILEVFPAKGRVTVWILNESAKVCYQGQFASLNRGRLIGSIKRWCAGDGCLYTGIVMAVSKQQTEQPKTTEQCIMVLLTNGLDKAPDSKGGRWYQAKSALKSAQDRGCRVVAVTPAVADREQVERLLPTEGICLHAIEDQVHLCAILGGQSGVVERLIRLDIRDLATSSLESRTFVQQAHPDDPLDPKIAAAMADAAHLIKGFQILPI